MGAQSAIAHSNATDQNEQGNDSVGFFAIEHSFDALLVELAQLNRMYLGLLTARDELPAATRHELSSASSDALEAMATCPFALFSMAPWAESEVERAAVCGLDPRCEKAIDSPTLSFALAAGFFAWHALRVAPSAARALLGLSAAHFEHLRALPLAKVHAMTYGMVVRSNASFSPRWANNEYFWVMLVRAAKEGSSDAMRAVHLLGRQLFAADAMGQVPDFVMRHARRAARPLGPTATASQRRA